MNLLSSEMVPVDATLDRAIVWSNDLDCAVALACADLEESDYLEEVPPVGWTVWSWPRLSALRSLIVGP